MPRLPGMATQFLRDIPLKVLHRRAGDERLTLLQACYDNPLFDENDPKACRGNKTPPHTANAVDQKTSSARTKDYMHCRPPQPHEQITFKSPKASRRRRIWIITFVVVAVILVAVVVGLLVHFLKENKTSHPIRTTPLPVIYRSDKLKGSLRIIDGPFSRWRDGFRDFRTDAFVDLHNSFKYLMTGVFRDSDLRHVYNDTSILEIRHGSVIINFIIDFWSSIDITRDTVDHVTNLIHNGLEGSVLKIDPSSLKIYVEVPLTTTGPVTPSITCEPIHLPHCTNQTTYWSTVFPNVFGDVSQSQAIARYERFRYVFEIPCHAYAQDFYCSAYTPECYHDRPIPPCRNYCEDVRRRCDGKYPDRIRFPVDCEKLPQSINPLVCRQSPYRPGKCIRVETGVCRDLGFNLTSYPNLLGSEGEAEAGSNIKLIDGIENATHCYRHSLLFACAVFVPKCSGKEIIGKNIIRPCRSLCKEFKSRCQIYLHIFYSEWPPALDCDSMPESPDENVCIGYKEAHEPPVWGDCKREEVRCDNSTCIPRSWVCDGYQDCADNTDESHCARCDRDEYLCPGNRMCVDKSSVCDGVTDCVGAVEESECVRLGTRAKQRLLEVRDPLKDQWQPVCADGWNITYSNLVCHQLGYRFVHSTIFEDGDKPSPFVLQPYKENQDHLKIQSHLSRGKLQCSNNKHVKITCQDPICGVRPAVVQSPLRIVGGDEVRPGTWPWLVSLHGGKGEKFFCGGSVINEWFVLTAAHCVGGGGQSYLNWTLKAGHTRKDTFSRYRQVRKGAKFFTFPGYDHRTVDNDIALIKLDEPLTFSNYLRPICLPKQGQPIPMGTRCIAAGWGKSSETASDYEPAVRQVQLDMADWHACQNAVAQAERTVPFKLTHNMICAGGADGFDACAGDSGGPFVCRKPNTTNEWYQAGIVSWGVACAVPNAPGIYTKLPLYVNWINQVIANNTDRS